MGAALHPHVMDVQGVDRQRDQGHAEGSAHPVHSGRPDIGILGMDKAKCIHPVLRSQGRQHQHQRVVHQSLEGLDDFDGPPVEGTAPGARPSSGKGRYSMKIGFSGKSCSKSTLILRALYSDCCWISFSVVKGVMSLL